MAYLKISKFLWLLLLSVFLIACGEDVTEDEEKSEVIYEKNQTVEGESYVAGDIEMVELIGEGCKDGEEYIEEEDICTLVLECDDYESCIKWGNEIVVDLEDTYGSLILEESVPTDLESLDVIATYDVDIDTEEITTEDNISQDTVDYHGGLWYSYAWLIPEYERPDMNRFEVFQSGDTLAHVYIHDEEAASDWTLGMNNENIELASETMITYIHEFAHLLSLRETEVDYYYPDSGCETSFIDERCFFEDAYMADYYNQFYSDGTLEATEDNYVSDYATTSITEDFAETFAHFVLSPQPAGDTLVEEKILFFYQYENLVTLRAEILSRAATWLDRTVID